MSRVIVHEIAGGLCVVCGDTVEWLTESGAQVAILD